MRYDICFSPALYEYYKEEGDIVVIVDILRATTTICECLKNGASSIIPVPTIEKAKEYKLKGYLVGAERNTFKCDFADFGNSPFEYTNDRVTKKDIVFTTTNCTKAINIAKNYSDNILIGSFSNISKVSNFIANKNSRVVVVCAGWNNKINIEDILFGGALLEEINKIKKIDFETDSVIIANELWNIAKENPSDYCIKSEHYKRLKNNNLINDLNYCFKKDICNIQPYYDKKSDKIKI